MKIIKLILLFLLLSATAMSGQDYQTINSGRTSFFENPDGNVKSVRIDSVWTQEDSILFPFKVIQQLDYNCYSPFTASWIGPKVIIKEDGINQFYNKNNDTIFIKTRAWLNDEWIACHLHDSIIVIATIIQHDTMSFLGLTDSVKTIGFCVYDKDMNRLQCAINNMNLQISRNYGFIKTLNFYEFPHIDHSQFPDVHLEEYSLIGLSSPKVGVQNLTWFDVHDFQIGDELHILEKSSSYDPWSENGYNYSMISKAVFIYIDRIDYQDSIIYQYSRKQTVLTTWTDSSLLKYYNDTLKTIIKPNPDFDKLPGEPIFIDNSAFSYHMANEFFTSKTDHRSYESIFSSEGSCWGMLIIDGCVVVNKYLKGLGGPYYECTNSMTMGGSERSLVNFSKGELTGGIPLIITGMEDRVSDNKVKVFPNPANDYLTIDFQGNISQDIKIEIFDLYGRVFKSVDITFGENRIYIDDLLPGIYIYRVSEKDGSILKTDKLIISKR